MTATPGAYPDLRIFVTVDRPIIKLGEIAWFTVDMRNVGTAPTGVFDIRNALPAGFSVIGGTSRLDNKSYADPVQGSRDNTWKDLNAVAASLGGGASSAGASQGGGGAIWKGFSLAAGQHQVLVFAVIAGPGAFPGNYPDRTYATDAVTGLRISNIAVVNVRVDPEPLFTQSWVLGKVFNDLNEDGLQQDGELGIAGARVAALNGQWAETDAEGRYHLDDPEVATLGRGSIYLVKLDPASLPVGSVIGTDNPRVLRLTQGLVQKADFGVHCPTCCHKEVIRTRVLFDACSDAVGADGRKVLADFVAGLSDGARATLQLRGEALCPDELQGQGLANRRVLSVEQALRELGVQSKEGVIKVQVGAPRLDGVEEMRRQRWVLRPHFDSGRAELKPQDLDRIAEVAGEVDGRVGSLRVFGHTDDERLAPGTQAEFADNQGLSQARARVVYMALRDALGKRQIELPLSADVRGFADTQPLANNRSLEGMALNRRVELQIDSYLPSKGKPVYMDAELEVLRTTAGIQAEPRPCSCWQNAGAPEALRLDVDLGRCELEPSAAEAQRLQDALALASPGGSVLLRLHLQGTEHPSVTGEERRLVLHPHFDSGSDVMDAASAAEIQSLARGLSLTVRTVSVDGHTDSQALAASSRVKFTDNYGLSRARAAAVEAVFVRALIDAQRPVPLRGGSNGFGPDRPVDSNSTPKGRAANRRVELVLRLVSDAEINPCGPDLGKRRYEALQQWVLDHVPPALKGKLDLRIEEAVDPEGEASPSLSPTPSPAASPLGAWLQRLRGRFPLLGLLLASSEAHSAEAVTPPPPCVSDRLDPGRIEPKLSARLRQNPLWLPPVDLPTQTVNVSEEVPVDGKDSHLEHFTLRPHFASGTDDLDVDSLEMILDAARSISGTVLTLKLVGHTDNNRLSPQSQARYEDNNGLSYARARSVGAIFLRGLDLDKRPARESVSIDGHGESEPIADNRSEAGKALNRRVEVEALVSLDTKHVETHTVTRQITITAQPQAPEFLLHCNYPSFVQSLQLQIFGPLKGPALRTLTASAQALNAPLAWDLKDEHGVQVPAGSGYSYVLTVYGARGRADRTRERNFEIRDSTFLDAGPGFVAATKGPREERTDEAGLGRAQGWDFDADDTAEHNIPLSGGTVIIVGQALAPGSAVRLNDETAWADAKGRFVRERILAPGLLTLSYKGLRPDGDESAGQTEINMPSSSFFMVGLAELTTGYGLKGGDVELADPGDTYPDKVWADGRVAFFLKGKVKGKYLLTAQLDSGEEPVGDLLDRLDARDPRQVFRRLDPDAYYPIYGDGSNTRMDVDTQGKFYLRLSSDQLQALWGNYYTDLRGGQLTGYQRALYGARAAWSSKATGSDGRPQLQATVFGAEALSSHGHDELRSTGGVLYWLSHGDLVVGSEQIHIEARDPGTGRVTFSTPLEPGSDYQVDWVQGRVMLDRELRQLLPSDTLARGLPAAGDVLYLVVDYEDTPQFGQAIEQGSVGGRLSGWLFPQLQLGAMAVREGRNEPESRLLGGVDGSLLPLAGLTITAEVAASQRQQGGNQFSGDGGLSYQTLPESDQLGSSLAHRVGLTADLQPSLQLPVRLDADARYLEQGYSSLDALAPLGRESYSARLTAGHPGSLLARVSVSDDSQIGYNSSNSQSLGGEVPLPLSFSASAELTRNEYLDPGYDPLMQTLLAARLNWSPSGRFGLYGGGQGGLAQSSGTPADNQVQAGLWAQLTRDIRATLDGSTGPLGSQARVGLEGRVDEGSTLYGSLQQRQDLYSGRSFGTTVGTRWRLSERWQAYAENQQNLGEHDQGLSSLFGIGWQAKQLVSLNASYSQSRLNTDGFVPGNLYAQRLDRSNNLGAGAWSLAPTQVDRDVISAGLGLTWDSIQFTQKAELRTDRGSQDLDQWVLSSFLDWDLSAGLSAMAKLNQSQAYDIGVGQLQAQFVEAGIGLAWRPVRLNTLNLVSKATWIDELSPLTQVDGVSFETQSQILSLEGVLELPLRLELSQKLAFKRSGTRDARVAGIWLQSDTWLEVTRLGYHLTKKLDAYGEYRRLWNNLSESALSGYLVGASFSVRDHVELGGGFNFTDFNDDLVRLSFRAYGPFIQVIGKW